MTGGPGSCISACPAGAHGVPTAPGDARGSVRVTLPRRARSRGTGAARGAGGRPPSPGAGTFSGRVGDHDPMGTERPSDAMSSRVRQRAGDLRTVERTGASGQRAAQRHRRRTRVVLEASAFRALDPRQRASERRHRSQRRDRGVAGAVQRPGRRRGTAASRDEARARRRAGPRAPSPRWGCGMRTRGRMARAAAQARAAGPVRALTGTGSPVPPPRVLTGTCSASAPRSSTTASRCGRSAMRGRCP